MRKVVTVFVTAMVISIVLVVSLGLIAIAAEAPYGHQDSAPDSGDGIPDGSGFDREQDVGFGCGPAPNSGDGVSDGSGFE